MEKTLQIDLGNPPGQHYLPKWIIYAAFGVPSYNVENWRLRVFGLVENPLDLSFAQLSALPQSTLKKNFHCVTGWSIKDAVWEGVLFKQLAEKAKVKTEADWVMLHCFDGYTAVAPLEDMMVEDSLIAFKINGKPLSKDQGYPARPFIPHLYGWKSAKWLEGIEFIKGYQDGYWEMYGYHERGDVLFEERFKDVGGGKHLPRRAFGSRPTQHHGQVSANDNGLTNMQ